MTAPIIVAISSDHHTNSTIGLCKPRVRRDDGGDYIASKAQRWLWACWKDYVNQVKEQADKVNASGIVTVLNGDICDGDHHDTGQIITRNEAIQISIAADVLEPLINITDELYIVRGTEAHVGKSASREELIAKDFDAEIDTSTGASSWWHLMLDVNGVLFDCAHHATMGRLPHTKPNSANKIAFKAEYTALKQRQKPPHLVFRSHMHQWADSGDNYSSRAIQLPGWQLATGYVHRIEPGALADIGGVIVTCWPDGTYDLKKVQFKPAPSKPVKVRL